MKENLPVIRHSENSNFCWNFQELMMWCHHSVMWLWCREGRSWAEDNGKNLASMQLSIYAEREIILRFSRTTPTLNNPLLCRRIWWHYRVSKGKYCFFSSSWRWGLFCMHQRKCALFILQTLKIVKEKRSISFEREGY